MTAIIQARMNSQRLPNKMLADIEGKPMLTRVIERVRQATSVSDIVVATTFANTCPITDLAEEAGVKYFVGSNTDVLDRYYQAATHFNAHTIIRICGDCPLIDPQVIDDAFLFFVYGEYDYVSNRPSYPDGFDVEVFKYSVLQTAWWKSRSGSGREHVTGYIQKHPKKFKIGRMTLEVETSTKFSVDTPEDLEIVRQVYRTFGEYVTLGDIIGWQEFAAK